jgi:hypothetical protein
VSLAAHLRRPARDSREVNHRDPAARLRRRFLCIGGRRGGALRGFARGLGRLARESLAAPFGYDDDGVLLECDVRGWLYSAIHRGGPPLRGPENVKSQAQAAFTSHALSEMKPARLYIYRLIVLSRFT